MKSLYVTDVRQLPGDRPITEVLFAVANMEIRMAATGVPYLALTLADRTGSIPGLIFDCDTIPTEYNIGDAVSVWGTFSRRYNNINIQQVTKYSGPIDPDDFLEKCPKDIDQMYVELLKIAGSIENPHLKALLFDVFLDDDIKEKFKAWPAAQQAHQAYIGGLIEHTLAVTSLCEKSAELYDVDRDLLIAGALLHDIGKLRELDCGLVLKYTDVGSLLGHSLLGSFIVRDKISNIEDFPEQLSNSLLHIIVTHHGRREWGAVVEPMTLEAFLVFIADYEDAKASRYQKLIQEQGPLEQNISPKDYFLGTAVYAPKVEEP